MKKYLLLFALTTVLSSFTYAQTLVKNEVDEFTGVSIKQSSFERLNWDYDFTVYARLTKTGNQYWLDIKMIQAGKVFAIDKGDELMLKLDDGNVVKLKNKEFTVTCRGCGAAGSGGSSAPGLQVHYLLQENEFNQLLHSAITKLRIHTTDGYLESPVKQKYDKKFKRSMELVGR